MNHCHLQRLFSMLSHNTVKALQQRVVFQLAVMHCISLTSLHYHCVSLIFKLHNCNPEYTAVVTGNINCTTSETDSCLFQNTGNRKWVTKSFKIGP